MNSLLKDLKTLIAIESTPDKPENLQTAIDFITDIFKNTPVTIKHYKKNNKPSVVISTKDTKTPEILLLGHVDIIPAAKTMFQPTEKDGRLLGRGACDMKSGVIIMAHALKELANKPNPPSVALMVTTDEEIGGKNGAGYLTEEQGYRTKVVLVPDTGQSPEDLVLTNKGILHITITATGTSAHGSRPWLGDNAIDKILQACTNIKNLFPTPKDESTWVPTQNIGTIQGGEATNKVPDKAECKIDIRITEKTTVKETLTKIKTAAKNCKVTVQVSSEASHTDHNHPVAKIYEETLTEVLGTKAKKLKHTGTHDGRYFTRHQIPTIASRPLSGGQHGKAEWLDIQSFNDYYKFYKKLIQNLSNWTSKN